MSILHQEISKFENHPINSPYLWRTNLDNRMTLGEYFEKGISYDEYMAAFANAVENKRTSGPIQTEELVHYTQLNLARAKRIFKHSDLFPETLAMLKTLTRKINIICITEFWCGDTAHITPVLELISRATDKIKINYLFRDENTDLMDRYLTNGGRSIPVYILIDGETGKELAHWGPRPANAQKLVMDMKLANTPYEEMKETMIRWYMADKTFSIQQEWTRLLSSQTI